MRSSLFLALVTSFTMALTASGQQFISRDLPGPEVWSEAALPIDANEDGKLDILILNAQGYETPGDLQAPNGLPLPPTLLINTGNDASGQPIWADQTVTLLPSNLGFHAKFAAIADFDNDGHDDIAIAAAFGARQILLRKDPVAGVFLDVSTRLPPMVLNSFYVAAGDLDDDGDIDLVFADAGPSTFGAPGGKARLLLNDGAGFFTEEAVRLGAINKIAAQNTKLIDIDGDLDLDIIVDGKSPANQLYINDGEANFALDTSTMPSSNQGPAMSTYEMEYADLDGDTDFDAVIMNFSNPMHDAVSRNDLVESGSLNFAQPLASALAGPNSHDENDFAFLDADDDGDLDLLVATLIFQGLDGSPATPEKLFLNGGSFVNNFLSYVPGAFDSAKDATLDIAIADFSGDGRYDVVTVQGEYKPFMNLFHLNVGPVDTHPPSILRVSPGGTIRRSDALDGIALRSVVCDSVVDDGYTFATASTVIDTHKGGETTNTTLPMPHIGGYVHRASFTPTPSSAGLVGMDVTWSMKATDPQGNLTLAPPQTARICGTETYGTAGPIQALALSASADPVPGEFFGLDVTGGAPSVSGILIVGFARVDLPLRGGTLLVDPTNALYINLNLGPSGVASLPAILPPSTTLVGLGAMLQYAAFDATQPQGLALSNGLELVICAD